jgi:hypothetical protein
LSKFIKDYKVFPYASDVGVWSLWIETPWGVGPLGPRFYFGGTAPSGGFDFSDKKEASEKAKEWQEYFIKRSKEKLKQ